MMLSDMHVDILVQGYPGKSVCHGALGWSTVALIRGGGRVIAVDVGAFSYRGLLRERLEARGLSFTAVTDVLLTHSHWDHSVNWLLFPEARVVIGEQELSWSRAQPWGTNAVPELYIRELEASPQLRTVRDGEEVIPGITAHEAPGHTPGCLVYRLSGPEHDIIFTGDAAKNRAELLERRSDMSLDQAASRRSIEMIWKLWQARPGSILLPGHDLPMVLEDGVPRYLGKRQAGITAWTEGELETTTLFELNWQAGGTRNAG
jgi:glyoxylase-like metal-dependent hydrolase (beta-lactamase superfamily II)